MMMMEGMVNEIMVIGMERCYDDHMNGNGGYDNENERNSSDD